MGEAVEVVLDFLRRHRFTKAEAALKEELVGRTGGDELPLSCNVSDCDLDQRLRSLQEDADHSLMSGAASISAPESEAGQSSGNPGREAGGVLLNRLRSPPEKHLRVEHESEKLECQESLCPSEQEFVFESLRTSPEPEFAVSAVGPYVSPGIYEPNAAFQIESRVLEPVESGNDLAISQGVGWTNSFQQAEGLMPCRLSVGSLEDLVEEGQARQPSIDLAGQVLTWNNREIQEQQDVENVGAGATWAAGLRNQSRQVELSKQKEQDENETLQRKQDLKGEPLEFQGGRIGRTMSLDDGARQECSSFQSEVDTPFVYVSPAKGRLDFLEEGSQNGEGSVTVSSQGAAGVEGSVKNGFLDNLAHEMVLKDPALKTSLLFNILKSSQSYEQQKLVTSERSERKVQEVGKMLAWVPGEGENVQDNGVGFGEIRGNPAQLVEEDDVRNQEFRNSDGLQRQEELPRLPPVRLHSMDKNIDNFKDCGSAADNSSRSLESAVFRSIGSTPEGSFGWGAFMDAPLGQDLSSSGLKRSSSRPSVSQGIVEDISEQLSGFATAGDGQSESAREYPDEYCDSDTYEDDDDPGYHRQPIEDEDWFLAHEIDYPSDDERARNRAEKNPYEQSGKLDEDDRSFVEEESYFSGEEYIKSQSTKEGHYRSQQSELRSQKDESQFTYKKLYSTGESNALLTLPSPDNGHEYSGQVFDARELNIMMSQPVWKGFNGQSDELEHINIASGGTRLDGAGVDGIDDERHGSVRSSGIMVCSDAADVGSEVRDSLLGGSSEGDVESFRDQELAPYSPAHETYGLEESSSEKGGRHLEVKSAPVRHIDEEEEDERDVILRYYNEAWGHTKRTIERDIANRDNTEQVVLENELDRSKHQSNGSNKEVQDNGAFMFGGFSFPSPSTSIAGSGKSLWSNRDSAAQGEETDEYGSGMVGPDDTLAAWKRKSNESSPIVCPSEENLRNLILSNHSTVSVHSTDEYVSLEPREDGNEEPDAGQLPESHQAMVAGDEDAAAVQEEIRRLGMDEDQFEIFDLRIVHRRNRTGFEEDKDFPVVINSVIAGRYHVTEYLGSAAFSKAIQAHDLHTGMDVCMKIIKNNKDFFDQSLDEIKLLKYVNRHDPADKYHILRLYDYFYHREHLFIVCELLRANLYEFHKFNRESGGEVYFTMSRLQSITRQCLEALEFLHKLGIIHCDLKPENILVKSYSRCEIKIIDLGSSCFQTDHLCSYVQSRSYRAPEVILGLPYDQKIDIWSLGCILAELCSGNVLFQNDSLATLLARVVGILGPIDPEVLAKGRDTHKYFTKNHMLYERNQESEQLEYLLPKKTTLSHRLPMGDPGFVEFVAYLLQNNPAKRPTATEALKHPWLLYPYEPISS